MQAVLRLAESGPRLYSHERVRQPGPLTRLLACDDDDAAERSARLDIQTYRHPDFSLPEHNRVRDRYAAYNKPAGVLHWLTHARPVERFVLIVESDMLLREPIDCEQLGVRPGVGASGLYEYLHGVHNGMARAFIKNVQEVQQASHQSHPASGHHGHADAVRLSLLYLGGWLVLPAPRRPGAHSPAVARPHEAGRRGRRLIS